METLPDLQSLSDEALLALLAQAGEAEEPISRVRRVLHARINILDDLGFILSGGR